MKVKGRRYVLVVLLSLGVVGSTFLFIPPAFAAEKASSFRRIWDNVMLVANFLVLVFIFMKYARRPLMDYLRGVREKVEEDLNGINGRLRDVKSASEKEADKLRGIDQRIKEIHESVIELGRREKEKIIEQARKAAEKMIQDAKAYSKYKMGMAKKALSDEIVESAIALAKERLVKGISEKENEKLTDQFIANLETSKQHFD